MLFYICCLRRRETPGRSPVLWYAVGPETVRLRKPGASTYVQVCLLDRRDSLAGYASRGRAPRRECVCGAWSPPAGHQAVRKGWQAPQTFVVAGIGDAQARHTPLCLYIERQRGPAIAKYTAGQASEYGPERGRRTEAFGGQVNPNPQPPTQSLYTQTVRQARRSIVGVELVR